MVNLSFDEGDTSGLNKLLSRSLKDPILGQHFALPGRTDHSQAIELDTSQSYIAVYTHLKVHATGMPEPLPTPEALEKRYTENLDGKSKINENRIRMTKI